MTSKTASKADPLIHAARIFAHEGSWKYLFLRKKGPQNYAWMMEKADDSEEQTAVSSFNVEEAIRQAYPYWKDRSLTMLHCGFLYSLPERDEHGINALFHQMIASYSSGNGIYFDADLGYNCFINFASDEAKNLWKSLEKQGRL